MFSNHNRTFFAFVPLPTTFSFLLIVLFLFPFLFLSNYPQSSAIESVDAPAELSPNFYNAIYVDGAVGFDSKSCGYYQSFPCKSISQAIDNSNQTFSTVWIKLAFDFYFSSHRIFIYCLFFTLLLVYCFSFEYVSAP